MSRPCPMMGVALYLDCLECEDKACKKGVKMKKYKEVCIGVDQSYKRTGISMSADGSLKAVKSIDLSKMQSKSEKRHAVKEGLLNAIRSAKKKADSVVLVFERERLFSNSFISMAYITSMGGMNAAIIDACWEERIEPFSVDTRCWKSQVIGTSKPESNEFGVDPKKWPTVRWLISNGFEGSIKKEVAGRRTAGTFTEDGIRYEYDNDASDSAAISMFWFIGDRQKLKKEL